MKYSRELIRFDSVKLKEKYQMLEVEEISWYSFEHYRAINFYLLV